MPWLRACLHGGGGPQVGKVTCLGGVKNNYPLHAILQPRHSGVHFLKVIEWSLSTKTRKMLANHEFWPLMYFYTPLLLLLQPSVQFLSIVNFNNDTKPPPKWILREFDVSRIQPRPGGLPHLEMFTWQNLTPAERVTRSGGSPYLSSKRDQIKMRDYMDRRVTPPKRVTSPTWGPPPPCKQALN